MAVQAFDAGRDDFARFHRIFVEHLGLAVGFAWLAAVVAACHVPWLQNIRALIDPAGRPESTSSFLFGLPVLLAAGWASAAFGSRAMRRFRLLRSQALEFAAAGLVAFAIFCMAIDRAVTAFMLGH